MSKIIMNDVSNLIRKYRGISCSLLVSVDGTTGSFALSLIYEEFTENPSSIVKKILPFDPNVCGSKAFFSPVYIKR